jgi:three-Cys-motif partner protein
MGQSTAIEWTNSTWNPVTGCTKLSAGCDNCYAERFAERFRGVPGHPFEPGFDLTLRPERIAQPTAWKRPQLIFVNSMSDLFHKKVPSEFVHQVFDTMEAAHWHTFQVLTKRSSLMRSFVNQRYVNQAVPPHIWLGVSIENGQTVGRLRHLKQTNASLRFVSFEPLLGPIGQLSLDGIRWAIAGGESGPRARPVDIAWLRDLRDQCQAQGVAFFFKQWGGRTPKSNGNELDGRQWLDYPKIEEQPQRIRMPARAAGAPVDTEDAMDVGPWAREKLECLSKYLNAYTTILRKQNFRGYFYIDAFAGPGTLKVRRQHVEDPAQETLLTLAEHAVDDAEEAEYIRGSPRVALELQHPFTDYVFIELDSERKRQLEQLKASHDRDGARIRVRDEDCNTYLRGLLESSRINWRQWRGVIFLDPFGMQVPWETIIEIGKTKAIEVFINFPVGMAIQRLLKRSGQFTNKERTKLDAYFGTPEWYDLLYEEEPDLLGGTIKKVSDSGDRLVRWYRKRLGDAFGYVSTAREIQNTRGRPLYYLIFAGPNKTGARIAGNVLGYGARKIQ